MQRLTGLDAGFLYLETPSSPMHVASVIVVDPAEVPGGFSIERVKTMFAGRLHLAEPFRRRLVEVPLGLHHPLWVEDPNFDLGWHIRHIACPAPGEARELAELAGHINAIPLDRTRPLWECWYIEGLEHGHVGILTKVHHAAIDGASGEEIMVALLDLTAEGDDKPPEETPWEPDRIPNDTELMGYAMASLAQQPLKAVKTARRTVEAALRIRETNRQPDVIPPPSPFAAPPTSFNRALTPHRSLGTATLSLSTVKDVKNAVGVKVNDVVLAVCAGALRRYLDGLDEHPDGPLVAMVPISVRSEDQKGSHGNRVSSMLTTLATDIDDPIERLGRIASSMNAAKEQQNAIGADTLQDWVEFAAPAIAGRAARLYTRTRMADRHRPLFNVTISNVPGPPFPLYYAGARVVATYPIGPIIDGGGLNITVMSYLDSLDFGLNACPELIPDVWALADALGDALEDLSKAVAAQRRTKSEGAAPS